MTAIQIDVPFATTVAAWAVLLAGAGVALVGLALLARRGRSGAPAATRVRRRRPTAGECARLRAEAAELAREATETSTRSQRAIADASSTADRRAEAQQAREEAGRIYDAAQQAYESALAAWRAGEVRRAQRARDEDDSQDREVSRAALAAYRRGDLSVDELREVFRRTGGWDPVQEQREREIGTLRAEAHQAHRAYDAAVAAERIATNEAGVARVAAQALVEEANAAIREAAAARSLAEECAQALRRRWFARSR